MTVKELKELLQNVPDNFEVRYEEMTSDDSYREIDARGLIVSKSAHCVLLTDAPNPLTIR